MDDATVLWRRVPLWPDWTVDDENLGRVRASSLAFDDCRDGAPMSMYLAEAGSTVDDVMRDYEGYALAAVSAGALRTRGLTIERRPVDGFPSRVEVVGPKTSSVRSKLAKASWWVVPPT